MCVCVCIDVGKKKIDLHKRPNQSESKPEIQDSRVMLSEGKLGRECIELNCISSIGPSVYSW